MVLQDRLYLKVILAGEAGVGKTSLRCSYLGKGFKAQHLSTIGADFATLTKQLKDIRVQFQIWDLAGQDFFENVRNLYYRGSLGALMVFDVTDTSSLEALNNWVSELEKGTDRGIVPFVLLGNKIDLLDEKELEQIRKLAEKFVAKFNKKYSSKGFNITYFETSAKTGENVHLAFEELGNAIIQYLELRKKMRGETDG
ncbi:MAG: Rab family GTPase [Candidatus Heimdallarchaeaceae archaeon]